MEFLDLFQDRDLLSSFFVDECVNVVVYKLVISASKVTFCDGGRQRRVAQLLHEVYARHLLHLNKQCRCD